MAFTTEKGKLLDNNNNNNEQFSTDMRNFKKPHLDFSLKKKHPRNQENEEKIRKYKQCISMYVALFCSMTIVLKRPKICRLENEDQLWQMVQSDLYGYHARLLDKYSGGASSSSGKEHVTPDILDALDERQKAFLEQIKENNTTDAIIAKTASEMDMHISRLRQTLNTLDQLQQHAQSFADKVWAEVPRLMDPRLRCLSLERLKYTPYLNPDEAQRDMEKEISVEVLRMLSRSERKLPEET